MGQGECVVKDAPAIGPGRAEVSPVVDIDTDVRVASISVGRRGDDVVTMTDCARVASSCVIMGGRDSVPVLAVTDYCQVNHITGLSEPAARAADMTARPDDCRRDEIIAGSERAGLTKSIKVNQKSVDSANPEFLDSADSNPKLPGSLNSINSTKSNLTNSIQIEKSLGLEKKSHGAPGYVRWFRRACSSVRADTIHVLLLIGGGVVAVSVFVVRIGELAIMAPRHLPRILWSVLSHAKMIWRNAFLDEYSNVDAKQNSKFKVQSSKIRNEIQLFHPGIFMEHDSGKSASVSERAANMHIGMCRARNIIMVGNQFPSANEVIGNSAGDGDELPAIIPSDWNIVINFSKPGWGRQ
jgi:hypothetical protein